VLQCVAVCCSVLQCVAVCCSVLHCVAVCCSVLQCVAVCCSVLQCVAVCCSMSPYFTMALLQRRPNQLGNLLIVVCNTLQHAATRYNALQHAATRCNPSHVSIYRAHPIHTIEACPINNRLVHFFFFQVYNTLQHTATAPFIKWGERGLSFAKSIFGGV